MTKRDRIMKCEVLFLYPYPGGSRWIGFRAGSENGEEKQFIWWSNRPQGIVSLERVCKAIRKQHKAETMIGPAVNLTKSLETGNVVTIEKTPQGKNGYGVYIESSKRQGFSFFLAMKGLRIK